MGVAIGLVAVDAQSKALVLVGALPFGATCGLCLVAGVRETERLSPADERGASNALFLTLGDIGFACRMPSPASTSSSAPSRPCSSSERSRC